MEIGGRGGDQELTLSIDNGFAVPFRNRDEGGGRLKAGVLVDTRRWFRAKVTITEPQMEPERRGGTPLAVA